MRRRTNVQNGWKVLLAEKMGAGKPHRYRSRMHGGSGAIIYPRNHWVGPEKGCGPLCVFGTHAAARNFAGGFRHESTILRCRFVPSPCKKIWTRNTWRWLCSLPAGTVLASEVKIIVPVRKRRNTR